MRSRARRRAATPSEDYVIRTFVHVSLVLLYARTLHQKHDTKQDIITSPHHHHSIALHWRFYYIVFIHYNGSPYSSFYWSTTTSDYGSARDYGARREAHSGNVSWNAASPKTNASMRGQWRHASNRRDCSEEQAAAATYDEVSFLFLETYYITECVLSLYSSHDASIPSFTPTLLMQSVLVSEIESPARQKRNKNKRNNKTTMTWTGTSSPRANQLVPTFPFS